MQDINATPVKGLFDLQMLRTSPLDGEMVAIAACHCDSESSSCQLSRLSSHNRYFITNY